MHESPVVHVYPADTSGCGAYRCILPAEALAADGADVRVVLPGRNEGLQVSVRVVDGRRVVDSVVRPDCDVLVLQRPLMGALVETIPYLQAAGVAVVVEVDDDFDTVHPQNVSWRHVQPHKNTWNNREHLHQACHLADLVTVSTPALAARYGKHGRVAIVPNRVPRWYFGVERAANPVPVCGWPGAVNTHPTDLEVTGRGVGKAVARAKATFRVIGPGDLVRRKLDLWHDPEVTGFVSLDRYPRELARLDIGIAPLADTAFNRAKSFLKPLELAAAGAACVASPVGEYHAAAAEGLCLLASTPKEWERTVNRLLIDADARAEVSARGRAAAGRHVLEDHLDSWSDAWALALSHAAARVGA